MTLGAIYLVSEKLPWILYGEDEIRRPVFKLLPGAREFVRYIVNVYYFFVSTFPRIERNILNYYFEHSITRAFCRVIYFRSIYKMEHVDVVELS